MPFTLRRNFKTRPKNIETERFLVGGVFVGERGRVLNNGTERSIRKEADIFYYLLW